MADTRRDTFSAAHSHVGYLYQCRLALLCALRKARRGEEFLLRLETLDDVVFEAQGGPAELLQTKHHLRGSADLTDASPDLWKTLRVWSERFGSGAILPTTSLYLITTSSAPECSAASYLRERGRDVDKALERLRKTAQTSSSQTNRQAYEAFLALGRPKQLELLEAIYIIDASPSILEIDRSLAEEIRWAVERKYTESFLRRLEGWWFRRAVRLLCDPNEPGVLSQEFEAEIDALREQFKPDALPIDEDIITATIDASGYQDAIFVQQLRLAGIGPKRVLAAIRDYFRAFEQRSRWLREDLLFVGELERYERRLVEEWELVFERVREELGQEAAEEAKREAARKVYEWAESAVFAIRPNVTEPFVTRGSYQILSDQLRVGWHPNFLERLQYLLERHPTRL